MLKNADRAELEEFRRQEQSNQTFGIVVLVACLVGIVAFFGAAYQADAFIEGGLDVTKMVRYYSKR